MKNIIYTFLLLFVTLELVAQNQITDSAVNKKVVTVLTKADGDSAYIRGDFETAISVYEQLLSDEIEAVDIYYNLGNAYYKVNNLGKSVLNYERAALLSPGDEDIEFNLELVRSKIVDKIVPTYKFFLVSWVETVIALISLSGWCIVGIIFFLILLLSILFFLFGKSIVFRKCCFFVAVFSLFLSLFANFAALHRYKELTERNEAIVISPSVTVRSTPSESGTELFVIHEGRKVKITDDSMKGWKEIELEDGNLGWVSVDVIERI